MRASWRPSRTSSWASRPSSSNFSGAWPTAKLDVGDAGTHRSQDLRWSSARRPRRQAERARARRDHADRLVPEGVRRERSRRPVEGVLQRTRDRRVVLGRRDEHGVRALDERAEVLDRRGARDAVVVAIVRRDRLQAPARSRSRRPRGPPPSVPRGGPCCARPRRSEPLIARTCTLRLLAPPALGRP